MKEDKEILVLGAFDRNNYGDLLFPFIVENQFNKLMPCAKLSYYGLICSDLSDIGAKPTLSIKEFYSKCNNKTDNQIIVVIGGGETITASWSGLFAFINNHFAKVFSVLRKYAWILGLNYVARFFLGGRTKLPFTFDKNNFDNVDFVFGNSLGGPGIAKKFFKKYRNARKELQGIDYLSVREAQTYHLLESNNIPSFLVPDSAILMSKIFDYKFLESKISSKIMSFVESNQYIFFQVKNSIYRQNEDIIISELENIQQTTNLNICLCPIGKALLHDDQMALKEIQRKLAVKNVFFDEVSIWEIMYLIANSECYVGTSLHGTITAMSFGRPYVGFNKQIKKLDFYLKQWSIEQLNECVSPENISSSVYMALEVDREMIKQKTKEQIRLVEESFEKMTSFIASCS